MNDYANLVAIAKAHWETAQEGLTFHGSPEESAGVRSQIEAQGRPSLQMGGKRYYYKDKDARAKHMLRMQKKSNPQAYQQSLKNFGWTDEHVHKGAWGNRYQSYGQDDMRNYNQGRLVAAGGAGTVGAGALYAHKAAKNMEHPNYAKKIARAKTARNLGAAALIAAPVIGVGNLARQRINTARNGQMNF